MGSELVGHLVFLGVVGALLTAGVGVLLAGRRGDDASAVVLQGAGAAVAVCCFLLLALTLVEFTTAGGLT